MKILDLCSGGGMLGLAVEMALLECAGVVASPIAYCEIGDYPRRILSARMSDGSLHTAAPILRDATRLPLRDLLGRVDLVCAGIPCQPHSWANRGRAGAADERWLWDDIAGALGALGRPILFLENVSGLLSSGAFGIMSDLAALGYDAEWSCLRASDVGQAHGRERLFILAADSDRERRQGFYGRGQPARDAGRVGRDEVHPRPEEDGLPQPCDCGVGSGVADRVDRTRAAGNGVDTVQTMVAFALLGVRLGLWEGLT